MNKKKNWISNKNIVFNWLIIHQMEKKCAVAFTYKRMNLWNCLIKQMVWVRCAYLYRFINSYVGAVCVVRDGFYGRFIRNLVKIGLMVLLERYNSFICVCWGFVLGFIGFIATILGHLCSCDRMILIQYLHRCIKYQILSLRFIITLKNIYQKNIHFYI